MIHKIMVISNGGLCLYYYDFSIMQINPQLVAGFTVAIDKFSETLISKEQNIEFLQMSSLNIRISPFLKKQLMMIVFFNRYDPIEKIDLIIYDLQIQFIENYGQDLDVNYIDMELYRSYNPIVTSLCRTHVNIAVLSSQSILKSKFWYLLGQINEQGNQKQILSLKKEQDDRNLNVIPFIDDQIKNCDSSLWNLDIENLEMNHYLFTDWQIFLIIIEPKFDLILNLISKIEFIKEKFPLSKLVGIYLSNNETISLKNCELILQIPSHHISFEDKSVVDNLKKFLHNELLGI